MKALSETPELLAVAERVVWFKPPRETLTEPVHFLAHVMTYGTVEDLRAVNAVVGPNEFLEALENAPPGVFDARSWAYWNLKYGRSPAPPLPVRRGLQRPSHLSPPAGHGASLPIPQHSEAQDDKLI